ncbi:class I SAM-dependent methyltransferase [Microcoleus sp. FACHB-68]|uniref:class I SAM-dependent methyltransferase n=1 Tax=Microcoleus sp. FACHB-68 TaxID=2692826 RepID=UPI0016888EEF|nr:class I SAM-dependent methyltransferase [Microcoleus sp. FACHB-68]MBD1936510.1 class I SAM-dependent methyltransferase [Microcoleus sp. FACHB-68]
MLNIMRRQFPGKLFSKIDAEVEGWCSKEVASCLWKFALKNPKMGAIVEIGSAWGKSTIVLAEASRRVEGGKVYAVDPHTGGIGYLKHLVVDKIDSFPVFQENLKKFNVSDMVVPIVETSERAAQVWNSLLKIRMLYIDGLHTAEGVEIDINSWLPFVAPGGTIIIDDYFEPSLQIYKAKIDELLTQEKVKLPFQKCSRLVYTYKISELD